MIVYGLCTQVWNWWYYVIISFIFNLSQEEMWMISTASTEISILWSHKTSRLICIWQQTGLTYLLAWCGFWVIIFNIGYILYAFPRVDSIPWKKVNITWDYTTYFNILNIERRRFITPANFDRFSRKSVTGKNFN